MSLTAKWGPALHHHHNHAPPADGSRIWRSEDGVHIDLRGLAEPSATVLQIGDTKNLRRVLYLTLQLAEMQRRQLLILNLQDGFYYGLEDVGARRGGWRAPARFPDRSASGRSRSLSA